MIRRCHDVYLTSELQLKAFALVVGSDTDAKEGYESLTKMIFFGQYFVQSVKFKHCFLVLKGLYAKMFSSFDNVLMFNKTYFGTSLLHVLICVWTLCSSLGGQQEAR